MITTSARRVLLCREEVGVSRIAVSHDRPSFKLLFASEAGGPHCPTSLFDVLSKPSLPKLSLGTKCVPTTAVAYFFAHVTLILINLSFLSGRQPLTLLPRPHLHSSPARPILSSSSFRFSLSLSLSLSLCIFLSLLCFSSLFFPCLSHSRSLITFLSDHPSLSLIHTHALNLIFCPTCSFHQHSDSLAHSC